MSMSFVDEDRDNSEQAGYAAIVTAAASLATCAHADATAKKLATRFLTIEIKRWGELDDADE